MEKLNISTASRLTLMERYSLTAEEELVIDSLFICFESRDIEPLARCNQLLTNELRNILISLQDKKVILKSCKIPNKGEALDWETLQFNDNFLRYYRKLSGELGFELFNAYPNEAIIQGQAVPLRNYAKKYKNEEEFYFQYGKSIGWNIDKHHEVLELIQWSKDNDHFGLNMNIGDFVGSQMWTSIKEHKDGSNAIVFDTTISV